MYKSPLGSQNFDLLILQPSQAKSVFGYNMQDIAARQRSFLYAYFSFFRNFKITIFVAMI